MSPTLPTAAYRCRQICVRPSGESELLRKGSQSALLLTDCTVMLVPQEEYDEAQAPKLYRYTVGGHDNDDIARAAIPELGVTAVFAVNHDVRVVLQDHFSSLNILPGHSARLAPSVPKGVYRRKSETLRLFPR